MGVVERVLISANHIAAALGATRIDPKALRMDAERLGDVLRDAVRATFDECRQGLTP